MTTHDILIVDDEEVVVKSVVKICALAGLSVDTATDGAMALEKVRRHSYRLLISDIMMPGYSGLELLRALVRQQVATPVIMTTGYTTVENAAESIMLGAIDFLPKPFTADELLNVVVRGLRHAELYGAPGVCDLSAVDDDPWQRCPAGYYRLGCTTWIHPESDGRATIGATAHYLRTLGDIAGIELFRKDGVLLQGNVCARIITHGGASYNLLCSASGIIVACNDALTIDPSPLLAAPFTDGWLYRIVTTEFHQNLSYLVPCDDAGASRGSGE